MSKDLEDVLEEWQSIAGGVPVELRVTGGSMRPLLVPGTILVVQPCGADDVRMGDVVVARATSGRVVAHRLVARDGDALVLRGDALEAPDPPIAPSDVLGRAVAVHRFGVVLPLDASFGRAMGALLARTPIVARAVNLLRAPAVRIAERAMATDPIRRLRRPRRLDTLVMLPGPTERPLLRTLVLDAGSPACLPPPDAPGTIVVAIARGQAVGCAWRRDLALEGVYVRPGWRRLGIGRTLVEVAIGDADAPVTTATPRDPRAEGLLRDLGFAASPDRWTWNPPHLA